MVGWLELRRVLSFFASFELCKLVPSCESSSYKCNLTIHIINGIFDLLLPVNL